MSVLFDQLATSLVYNSLYVFLAAAVVYAVLRWLRPNSPRLQQAAWLLVLVPGCLLVDARFPVEIVSHWQLTTNEPSLLPTAPSQPLPCQFLIVKHRRRYRMKQARAVHFPSHPLVPRLVPQ